MRIYDLREVGVGDASAVGGKAAGLGELGRASVPIPDGIVVILADGEAIVEEKILARLPESAWGYAVRSSAVGEDGREASWAGQLESYLGVGREEVGDKVRACMESGDRARVKVYGEKVAGVSLSTIAVIVQVQIASEKAGTIFTVNPVTGSKDEMMIEVVAGLGETLAQGEVVPGTWTVARESGEVRQWQPAWQEMKKVWTSAGMREVAVGESERVELSDEEVRELWQWGRKIEKIMGTPQDIEWAIMGQKVWILQSRPITTLGSK